MDLPARAAHGQERVCARAREDSEAHEKWFRVWDGELQQTLEAAAEGRARGAPLVRCGGFVWRGGGRREVKFWIAQRTILLSRAAFERM